MVFSREIRRPATALVGLPLLTVLSLFVSGRLLPAPFFSGFSFVDKEKDRSFERTPLGGGPSDRVPGATPATSVLSLRSFRICS